MKLCSLLLLVGLAVAERRSYVGYKGIEIVPTTVSQAQFLATLEHDVQIDLWTGNIQLNKPVRMVLHQEYLNILNPKLDSHGLSYTIFDEDIHGRIEKDMAEIEARRAASGMVFDINDYNTLFDIDNWLDARATECDARGLSCLISSVGPTHEGRQMKRLSMKASSNQNAQHFSMDATIHAREWLATATCLYFVNEFINNYGSNPDVTRLLDTYTFHFIPVLNPDGYDYTWTTDRLWRKNRRDTGAACDGVDLNRNFNYRWGDNGADTNPCSQAYMGPSAESEPETKVMQQHFNTINEDASAIGILAIHSYSNLWLHPYGFTITPGDDGAPCQLAPDDADLSAVGDAAAAATQAEGGQTWQAMNMCAFSPVSGVLTDYTYAVSGIKYSYAIELRGNRFDPPASEIPLSYAEIYAGVIAYVNEIERIG